MSADKITYCLERLTDYRDFERLCSALLAGAGYPGIDPLGGTGDGGRDAVMRTPTDGLGFVFAYTVREDWRTKLKRDCSRLRAMQHQFDVLVFVCTVSLSAAEKDWAQSMVADEFGWRLDLFDLERLRVRLVGPQRHLVSRHPSIFTPSFFPQRGGEVVLESRDLLIIDHVDDDHALATWLARRLTLAGFSTWCRGTAPLVGENADASIRLLLETRAQQYIPILSPAGLSDELLRERCVVAGSTLDLVTPCSAGLVRGTRLPSRLSDLTTAEFGESWMTGLRGVLARLSTRGIEPSLDAARGRSIALGDYLPVRVTVATPEPVFANVFPLELPDVMFIVEVRAEPSAEQLIEWRQLWPCAKVTSHRFASFLPPPDHIKLDGRGQLLWKEVPEKDGRRTRDIAKELARRSLECVCVSKGLRFCANRKVYYYPERERGEWVQPIRHIDGRNTTVQLTGERTKGWGDRASTFAYQLAPLFSVQADYAGNWTVVVSVYIRVTTLEGALFEGKEIGRRRKVVSKGWWNNKWLPRLLGIVQGLETEVGCVRFGEGSSAVIMQTAPLMWECPVGLDIVALSGGYDLGEELAEYRSRDDEGDETTSDVSTVEEGN
ncbi:hypothetical protein [Pelomonas cellulosilytica]|uniref:TIR domain-containing protein n=1 Tax=Pelomonas cellulosilytica TaxID=2906762 RepID=A0ABS8XTU4_9BURK|nr:hypothetical protein [Pelomonas sp. P8]MCE4554251.1 hypothetical protein [Pelomonas sp. P8]